MEFKTHLPCLQQSIPSLCLQSTINLGYFGCLYFSKTGAILDTEAILDAEILAEPAYRLYIWVHYHLGSDRNIKVQNYPNAQNNPGNTFVLRPCYLPLYDV